MTVELKIIDDRLDIKDFKPATPGSAAIDLHACIDRPITLAPGDTSKFPAGFAVNMQDVNMAAIILPRSGKGSDGLVLANLVGLVDSDYQGQICVPLWNRSGLEIYDDSTGNYYDNEHAKYFTVEPMDAIAQLIFIPILHPVFELVDTFGCETLRGDGGFGSTNP